MIGFEASLSGCRVLVTGHTGFKGSWLTAWLHATGAEIHGIALTPNTNPSLFEAADLLRLVHHHTLDIREGKQLAELVADIDPEVVFHLAAQPLVRQSYDDPLHTLAVNVIGTANVLEACRNTRSTRVVVCVTTDKVYRNNEWPWPYREIDPLGGKDPYSASKAAAEIVADCYRQTLNARGNGLALATARGGNVIGGGDWALDRLIPDIVRAMQAEIPLPIRHPDAVRPWQHVLSLCHGYLALAAGLLADPDRFDGAWNFSPGAAGTVSVSQLLQLFEEAWRLPQLVSQPLDGRPEAGLLALDSSKASQLLNWRSPWSLEQSVERTANWYRRYAEDPSSAFAAMCEQIHEYRSQIA